MNSPALEKEGLKRNRAFLQNHEIRPTTLITDRHLAIQKYVREEWPEVTHMNDSWHVAKGLLLRVVFPIL